MILLLFHRGHFDCVEFRKLHFTPKEESIISDNYKKKIMGFKNKIKFLFTYFPEIGSPKIDA